PHPTVRNGYPHRTRSRAGIRTPRSPVSDPRAVDASGDRECDLDGGATRLLAGSCPRTPVRAGHLLAVRPHPLARTARPERSRVATHAAPGVFARPGTTDRRRDRSHPYPRASMVAAGALGSLGGDRPRSGMARSLEV